MPDLNVIFAEIAERSDSGFMPANSLVAQFYPKTMKFEVISAYEAISESLFKKTVTGMFPFQRAFCFKICTGDGCDLFDAIHDKKVGDEELDSKYRIHCDSGDLPNVKRLLLTPKVKSLLMSLNNVRIEMTQPNDAESFELMLTEYGDTVNIERMVNYVSVVNKLLCVMMGIVLDLNQQPA